MAGGWGSTKNKVKIGVFWDDILVYDGGAHAKITDPHINIDRDVNITDTSNNLSWSGGAVTNGSDANINVSGSGEKRIKTVSAEERDLLYGAPHSASFAAEFSGINYAGGTLTASKSVTFPARPYELPAAPTIGQCGLSLATTNPITMKWTNNSTGGSTTSAPYSSVMVERIVDAETVWVAVSADLPADTTSWTDSSPAVGHRYKYRVRAKNSTGTGSPSAESPWIYTAPPAVASITLVKVGTEVTINWSNAGTTYCTGTQIRALRPSPTVTHTYTVAAPGATLDDPNEATGVIQQYNLRHYISAVPLAAGGTTTLYSAEKLSNPVQLAAPPLAPNVSVLYSILDGTDTSQTVYFEHNPVDAVSQLTYQYQTRYWINGGGTWSAWAPSAEITSAATSFTLAGLPNGLVHEVQVRTKANNGLAQGPYSPPARFTTNGRPTAGISAPASGTINSPSLGLTLSYSDPEGGGPAAWIVRLYAADGVTQLWPAEGDPEEQAGSISGGTFVVPFSLDDAQTYKVTVQARDAAGLWSAVSAASTYAVEFLDPVPAVVSGFECLTDVGAIRVEFEIPVPYGIYTDATSAVLQRLTEGAWLDVCEQDVVGGGSYVCVDPIPPLGVPVEYRVVTMSDIPTSTGGAEGDLGFTANCAYNPVDCLYPDGMLLLLNAGDDWSVQARIIGGPKVSHAIVREKELVTPVGRVYPIELIGPSISETFSISGVVARDGMVPTYHARLGALRSDWVTLATMPAPICYRDPFGARTFVSIGQVQTGWDDIPVSPVSAELTRVTTGTA